MNPYNYCRVLPNLGQCYATTLDLDHIFVLCAKPLQVASVLLSIRRQFDGNYLHTVLDVDVMSYVYYCASDAVPLPLGEKLQC